MAPATDRRSVSSKGLTCLIKTRAYRRIPEHCSPRRQSNRDQERVFRFADGIGGDHTALCSLTPTFPAPPIGRPIHNQRNLTYDHFQVLRPWLSFYDDTLRHGVGSGTHLRLTGIPQRRASIVMKQGLSWKHFAEELLARRADVIDRVKQCPLNDAMANVITPRDQGLLRA
jgi:hypothetical protein